MLRGGNRVPADSDALLPSGDSDQAFAARPVNETILMNTAVKQVAVLVKARRWYRIILTALGVCVAGLIITSAILAITVHDMRGIARNQQAAIITGCQNGNAYRAGDELGWQAFIRLAVAGSKNPKAAELFVRPFLAYIHKLDAPHDCSRLSSP